MADEDKGEQTIGSEAETEENKGDVIQSEEFPTLELTLEEARRQYDDEERRRAAVENKIGLVITVDALLISFGALFSRESPLLLFIMLAPALVSAGLGLYAIRSREYNRPGKHIRDFHEYSQYDDVGDQREQLLLDYETTTGRNKEKNDPKFEVFNQCIALTFVSLVLVLVIPLTQGIGVVSWVTEQWRTLIVDILLGAIS
jgi:hypothetical protein